MSGASGNNALATFFNEDTLTPWEDPITGPALALPEKYKAFKLKGELYVEYLHSGSTNAKQGEGETGTPSKNHVVLQVPFEEDYTLYDGKENVRIRGARISMDLSVETAAMRNINEERRESYFTGQIMTLQFWPGTLYVKLLKYEGRSIAANKIAKFPDLEVATLGDLVAFIKSKGLHEMSFLDYELAFKGCRDFITQTYLQLRAENKVSATDRDGKPFKYNIAKVHHKNGGHHEKRIERGHFLNYDRIYPEEIEDAYEEEGSEGSG